MSKPDKPTAQDFPASAIHFEEYYEDGSGVAYAVRYNANENDREIQFEESETIATFPHDKLEWLINCLLRIRDEAL